MSDFQKYKKQRIEKNPEFWKDYEDNLETFKLGAMLKQARKNAGLTQAQIASELNTSKSAISRMENHAKDISVSTLKKFAKAIGKHAHISFI
ncbi:MAG: transcriptional regulator [Deltaproteobacteria bacterium]|nr:MAG: transcriptional regulator [Deltaproteobacteria bacterium]